MKKSLLSIIILFFTGVTQAQTETYFIDWSFDSTPDAEGDANSNRTIEEGDTVTWVWYANGTHNVNSNADAAESFESSFQGNGATFSHTFTVVGTNDYLCTPHPSSMFGTITVVPDGTLSDADFLMSPEDVILYPNPVENVLSISLNASLGEDVKISIYNAVGQKVKDYKQNFEPTITMDFSDFNTGMYFIRIENGSSSVTKGFIKK